ncbi:hypothetical protein [Frigoriflavimonas asaccharolytica]|uniref:Uncharacterized protein n=1 Tax=Frigoriflavimonas asaccharolytica TaxID=2735899 RepID=A0A8J8G658_9FLAO|nr:hypothetical protein [Frigoriflavimonas asaccharolytica]NRS91961.1 hypothetical protein [Frigoriflavimonas asaccharolytica]
MDAFLHIKSIIGIILGLSLTHLIKSSVYFIQHPGRKKIYLLHFMWVVYVFTLIIHFWWWEFNLKLITEWFFVDYLFIILYIILFYMLCAILYPDDLNDYDGYKDYFFSRKKWFFTILALCFAADIVDTYLKGEKYFSQLGNEYLIRNVSHIVFCVVAVFIKNKIFHYAMASAFIIYEIIYIVRFYNLEV